MRRLWFERAWSKAYKSSLNTDDPTYTFYCLSNDSFHEKNKEYNSGYEYKERNAVSRWHGLSVEDSVIEIENKSLCRLGVLEWQ